MTSESSEDEAEKHAIFSTDPAEWIQYVYKEVSVVTDYKGTHTGWVYTVDPVSQSLALVKFVDGQANLEVVLGKSVESIEIINHDTETHRHQLDDLFRPNESKRMSAEELKMRQIRIKSWLLKNRIPVEETGNGSGVLSISDVLFIEPPYGENNCQSTNEIILDRIQGLIRNMPVGFDPSVET